MPGGKEAKATKARGAEGGVVCLCAHAQHMCSSSFVASFSRAQVKQLWIVDCQLHKFPPNITKMVNLWGLYVSGHKNYIIVFPDLRGWFACRGCCGHVAICIDSLLFVTQR